MLFKLCYQTFKNKYIMSEKWTKIQLEYDGRESDVNDFMIYYHKEIDGKMYYIKEQGGKIISKTLSKNIIR